jgi:hypothetical protein
MARPEYGPIPGTERNQGVYKRKLLDTGHGVYVI